VGQALCLGFGIDSGQAITACQLPILVPGPGILFHLPGPIGFIERLKLFICACLGFGLRDGGCGDGRSNQERATQREEGRADLHGVWHP
jgi:hypothetical protein